LIANAALHSEAAMRSLRLYHVYEGEGALTP